MRKYVCSRKEIEKDLVKYGYDVRFLFFPRSDDWLLYKTFDSRTLDEFYFYYDKHCNGSVMITKEAYYRYITDIDNFNFNSVLKLSRLSRYSLGVVKCKKNK